MTIMQGAPQLGVAGKQLLGEAEVMVGTATGQGEAARISEEATSLMSNGSSSG